MQKVREVLQKVLQTPESRVGPVTQVAHCKKETPETLGELKAFITLVMIKMRKWPQLYIAASI
ncbi:hypothetical protein NHH88_12600 [Oxalobacteraceae bacterium OTU3CAMAD1]|nr:hypothetical protein NHH88_12600 [Oxalobacteraceae bacterium OTU3CAMAD1]